MSRLVVCRKCERTFPALSIDHDPLCANCSVEAAKEAAKREASRCVACQTNERANDPDPWAVGFCSDCAELISKALRTQSTNAALHVVAGIVRGVATMPPVVRRRASTIVRACVGCSSHRNVEETSPCPVCGALPPGNHERRELAILEDKLAVERARTASFIASIDRRIDADLAESIILAAHEAAERTERERDQRIRITVHDAGCKCDHCAFVRKCANDLDRKGDG